MYDMREEYSSYLQSLSDSDNSRKTAESHLRHFDFDDISKWNNQEYILSQFEKACPKSTRGVKTRKSSLKSFFKYLYNNTEDKDLRLQLLENQIALTELNGTYIWKNIHVEDSQRFISNKKLKDIIKEMDVSWDNPNAQYYATLFLAVYEGMYTDTEFAVIRNARLQDIHGNSITLYDKDGSELELEISSDLKKRMEEVAKENYTYRANRHGYFQVPIYGEYNDSIFKTEERLGKKDNVVAVYRAKIKKVVNEFLDFDLKPKALYVSGLVYRISELLKENGYTLEDAFGFDANNKEVIDIVRKEMIKSNYPYDLSVLKGYVRDNLSDFEDG